MGRLLDRLDFTNNPFSKYVAENEPEIDQYFVRPPYFATVRSCSTAASSIVLFGARGAGKSATRIALYKEAWSQVAKGGKTPLVVSLTNYTLVLRSGLNKASLRELLIEVGYITTEALLLWLSSLPDSDRDTYIGTLTPEEERLVIGLIERFYLSRPEASRSITGEHVMRLLAQAWHDKAQHWARQKWSSIAGVLAALIDSFSKSRLGEGIGKDHVERLLAAGNSDWNEAHFARSVLDKLVELVRLFGFSGLVVLVDKVDETDQTNNSAEATAQLLFPILSQTQLMEVEHLGWMMFLWDKVKDHYGTGKWKVRLDKIAHAEINWSEKYLSDLIKERLRHFSKSRITSFAQLCEPEVDEQAALKLIFQVSMNSPRELMRVMDTIIREHDNSNESLDTPPLLTNESINKGLDTYAIESIRATYKSSLLQQIRRLPIQPFINRDVQSLFRINEATARNRIRNWADAGVVAQTGTRPAEGGSGGKPSHEYSVVDYRLKRLIERELSLGSQFDNDDDLWVGEETG